MADPAQRHECDCIEGGLWGVKMEETKGRLKLRRSKEKGGKVR